MINEIADLLSNYTAWLTSKTHLKEVRDWVEITTPYLDRDNDYIQIYVKQNDNGYLLTDDGHTVASLIFSGCNLDSEKRQSIMNMTLRGFGIKNKNGELYVESTRANFPQKKHNLIQSILAINDLFYLASPYTTSIFLEDVTNWFKAKHVRFISDAKFTGTSGFDHLFDFTIPESSKYPSRFIKTINNPSRDTALAFAFAWTDIRDIRLNSSAIALLNDSIKAVSPAIINALKSYEIDPIPWSQREAREEVFTG
jgi:hypothetical protein